MMEAYRSGDPYLAFAKQAGAVPPTRRRRRTGGPRAVQAVRAGRSVRHGRGALAGASASRLEARELLRLHRETYRDVLALVRRVPWTTPCSTARSTRSSAGGARAGRTPTRGRCGTSRCRPTAPRCCASPAAWPPSGASGCAPPSTTPILIEAPRVELDDAVQQAQAAMAEASRIVSGASSCGRT